MNDAIEQVDTKDRILDAAERLFGEQGIEAASLRSITSAAGVNLAAVNYHFRSKQALAEAVLARRVGPANEERLALLNAYLKEAGDGPVSLERVLDTFLAPAFRVLGDLGERGVYFAKFMGRMHSEPREHARAILQKQFGVVIAQYGAALRRALPQIRDAELAWGIHFTIGAMAQALLGGGFVDIFARGGCDRSDTDALCSRLVAYTAAGLRALEARR